LEASRLERKLQELQEHGKELDKHLLNLERHRDSLKYDETYARYAYVTYEDLELLNHKRFYKDLGMSPT
jgi:hypothetical protein